MLKNDKIIIAQKGAPNLDFKEIDIIQKDNSTKKYLMPDCRPLLDKWKKSDKYTEIANDPKGKTEHPGSRVNDVYYVKMGFYNDNLDLIREELGFQYVCPENLYKIKSGEHKGKYAAANIFEMNNRKYIVNQSPFYNENYYEMIIEENIQMVVSLARPGVDVIDYYRQGFPLSIHSLDLNASLKVNGYKIECIEQKTHNLSEHNKVYIKTIRISANSSRLLTIIDCRDWADIGSMNNKGIEGLANLMDELVHQINPNNPRAVPAAFNCAYGFGRAPTALLLWEFKDAIRNAIASKHNISAKGLNIMDYPQDILDIEIDFNSFISYMSENIMGCASAVHREQMEAYISGLKDQAKKILQENQKLEKHEDYHKSKNLSLSVEYLLKELSRCNSLAKRKKIYNSFLLLINSGINPGFSGEMVQISKEDFADIDNNLELLNKMKEVFELLLTDEQKAKNPKMPLLSKIFRSPYARKVSAAATLMLYYSKTTNSLKLILQENKRRKGVFCYTSAGFENTLFTNPKGEIFEDREASTKLPDGIDGAIYNSTPYSGKFDVPDFNAASVKALEEIGYFKTKFKWNIINLNKYRDLTIENLLAIKDAEGKNKYTKKDLEWIKQVDLNPLFNAIRELGEETGMVGGFRNIIPLRNIDSAGSMGSFLNNRNEVLQNVLNYGIYLGYMEDDDVVRVLNPGDDCNKLFIIDLENISISKNEKDIDILSAKKAIMLQILYSSKSRFDVDVTMPLSDHKFLSTHIKEFCRKLGNVIIKDFAKQLCYYIKNQDQFEKFKDMTPSDEKMVVANIKASCKRLLSSDSEDLISLSKRVSQIISLTNNKKFCAYIINDVAEQLDKHKKLEKFSQSLQLEKSEQRGTGFF